MDQTTMGKMSRINELEAKIENTKKENKKTSESFVRTLYPEFTEDQIIEGGSIISEKFKEIARDSIILSDSLDKCETIEDISAWRLKNNF